jgi:methylenetetrahydrofolate dehydrogenase (NADP+)/methenyltetrahydrofolate cyclohydrolase
MPARIIDGRRIADLVLAEVQAEIQAEVTARPAGRPPGLAAVLVGDDPASQIYVKNKLKACAQCGIESTFRHLPASSTQADVGGVIAALNAMPGVDGILLQLPLPRGLDAEALLAGLDPRKDVDGLHAVNLGKLAGDDPTGFVPCTPAGVIELLQRHAVDPTGRRVVVVGRSKLVGKPAALLLMRKHAMGNATVTVVHTQSRDVPALVREAEILIAAAGSPRFIRGEWLRPEAVVIDVGIHRVADPAHPGKTRLVGDVDFDAAARVASAITPVPGGVGPMTVAMLMRNTLAAWKRNRGQ